MPNPRNISRLKKVNSPKKSVLPRLSLSGIKAQPAGFALLELSVAVAILGVAILGLLQLFIHCSNLMETAKNLTLAMSEAQGKMEEISNCNFSNIPASYGPGGSPGSIFNPTQVNGTGVIYINSGNSELLEIEIVLSWQNKNRMVVGEDKDLDGVLDAGEDTNANGKLDAAATLTTMIAKR